MTRGTATSTLQHLCYTEHNKTPRFHSFIVADEDNLIPGANLSQYLHLHIQIRPSFIGRFNCLQLLEEAETYLGKGKVKTGERGWKTGEDGGGGAGGAGGAGASRVENGVYREGCGCCSVKIRPGGQSRHCRGLGLTCAEGNLCRCPWRGLKGLLIIHIHQWEGQSLASAYSVITWD